MYPYVILFIEGGNAWPGLAESHLNFGFRPQAAFPDPSAHK